MPYADAERQREYQRQWVARRRAEWLDGKACVDCGATDNLEVDHLDANEKVDHRIWSWAADRRAAELAKCVVRCAACHQERHGDERRRHGIKRYAAGCRCDACGAAKSAHNARYYDRERRRRESNSGARLCRPLRSHSATAPDAASYDDSAEAA